MSETTLNNSPGAQRTAADSVPAILWGLERLPLLVLILSVTFLQGYALVFWGDLLGRPGWGVSVGIELIHLWAWYRAATLSGFRRVAWAGLALVATGLLLASALHEVTRPLQNDAAQIQAAVHEQSSLQAEADQLRANLAAYREMAADQGRLGWQKDIRRDTAQLQAVGERLRVLAAQAGDAARQPWLQQVTQVGVVAVALLFQLAAVLAVWSISGACRNTGAAFRPDSAPTAEAAAVSETISAPTETFRAPAVTPERDFLRLLWVRIEAHARSNSARLGGGNGKVSQAALAADLEIKPPDLSGIKLIAQGQSVPRNPSRDAVERLANRFGVEMPK